MRILHVPFCYHPDPVGGTEVYVQNLAAAQKELGAQPVIAAPGRAAGIYEVAGIAVHRFPTAASLNLSQLYGEGDPCAAQAFVQVMKATRPDAIHLHAFTAAVSLQLVEAAKEAGRPVVFTYHTPTASCQRGTLMRWGKELCDGRLDVPLCAACSLQGLGLRTSLAAAAAKLPASFGRALGDLRLAGGFWTALRMTELVTLRHKAFRELMRRADRVISLCSWVSELLQTNGVPPEKIELCRHGLPTPDWSARPDTKVRSAGSGCRLAFLGRIHPTKGLEQLLNAIAAAPELKLTLDIYGITQSAAEVPYREKLLALCDSRIRWLEPVASGDVVRCLAEYDALAVPSQWLETGPLVVLEAFAAGVPVVGSDLGGIRELVRHEIDGLLVPAESVTTWTKAVSRLSAEPGLLDRLRAGIRPPRTMRSVAAQMLDLYERLTTQRQLTSATAFI